MSDFNLSSFLQEQATGGVSHGEGDFTISHEKAAKKMAEYSLPREHAWVLKLVQAGVGWGCEEIKLTQTRVHTTFHFRFSEYRRLPTNKELVTAILRADLESTNPLDAFAMGLRLVVEKSHLSFLLLIDTGDVEPQAIYAGVYFGELDEKERAAKRRNWSKGVTVMIHHIAHTDTNRLLLNYIPVRRHGLPMITEIEEYAFTSPIPITVDGRRVDGIFRSSRFGWRGEFKPLRAGGVNVPAEQDISFTISPGFDDQIFSVFTPRGKLSKLNTPYRSDAFFTLAAASERVGQFGFTKVEQSTLFWVRDGVIVDSEPLPRSTIYLRLYVFVSARGLRSDLTGFQLIYNEERTERVKEVLRRVGEALQAEHEAKRDFLKRPPTGAPINAEQLDTFSPTAQAITKGLQKADRALAEELESPLAPYRDFARKMVRKSLVALQIVVQEPDYWTRTSFEITFPDELKRVAAGLGRKASDDRDEEPAAPLNFFHKGPEIAELSPSKKEEKFTWVPPDER